ncbi:LysR substrate-binding domain-containing protein, partial [Pseudomonas sp. P7548]
VVAAPDYLKRCGTPLHLGELARHQCLPFVMPSSGRVGHWLFRDGEREIDWAPAAGIEVTDDVLGIVSLAEHGLGLCQTYEFIVRERLANGRLVKLLEPWSGRTRPFSLI